MLYPTKGILFSGNNIAELSLDTLHNKIGFVMQESALFNASICENLRYGKKSATDDELVSACQKALIYDYIKTLPHGFDTIIGERGVKLSGG